MKFSKIFVTTMALCLALTSLAYAQEQRQRPQGQGSPFETMDKNKDGKISKEEASGRFAEEFDTLDSNKDGFISSEEFEANAPKDRERPQGERPAR